MTDEELLTKYMEMNHYPPEFRKEASETYGFAAYKLAEAFRALPPDMQKAVIKALNKSIIRRG